MARAADETGVPFLAHTMYWRSRPGRGAARERRPRLPGGGGRRRRRLAARAPDAGGAPRRAASCRRRPTPLDGRPGLLRVAASCSSTAGIAFADARRVSGADEARRRGRGDRLPGRAQGARTAAQVGLRRRRRRPPRPRGAERTRSSGWSRALDPPSYSVEAMAPLSTRARADRRRQARSALRPDPARGRGRPLRRDRQGRRGRARARDRGRRRGAPPLAAGRAAPGRRARPAGRRRGRRGAAAAALSRVAAEHPEIAEIEINPLLATPDGALGLDARIVLGRRCSLRAHSTARSRSSPEAEPASAGRWRSSSVASAPRSPSRGADRSRWRRHSRS